VTAENRVSLLSQGMVKKGDDIAFDDDDDDDDDDDAVRTSVSQT
jgi:hypothetical protein